MSQPLSIHFNGRAMLSHFDSVDLRQTSGFGLCIADRRFAFGFLLQAQGLRLV